MESFGQLEQTINASLLNPAEFTLSRKYSYGASDSSVLLGTNLYKTMDQLIIEKQTRAITDEEFKVGQLPAVRKGSDLEEFILRKASEELGTELLKPKFTYKFKEFPFLTVNYDGIIVDEAIPVEAKLVTKYGEKYYKKELSENVAKKVEMHKESEDITTHCKLKALKFGIPAYYYTQVQQEIMGLNAPYGYLMAWFDDSWIGKLFYIKRDDYVIRQIINKGEAFKDKLLQD
jgi:predicted phage-related endonuclease